MASEETVQKNESFQHQAEENKIKYFAPLAPLSPDTHWADALDMFYGTEKGDL